MKYVVWEVIENTKMGNRISFYVINCKDKKVQSVWKRILDARAVCANLNRKVS